MPEVRFSPPPLGPVPHKRRFQDEPYRVRLPPAARHAGSGHADWGSAISMARFGGSRRA